jgi:hypothetical protein
MNLISTFLNALRAVVARRVRKKMETDDESMLVRMRNEQHLIRRIVTSILSLRKCTVDESALAVHALSGGQPRYMQAPRIDRPAADRALFPPTSPSMWKTKLAKSRTVRNAAQPIAASVGAAPTSNIVASENSRASAAAVAELIKGLDFVFDQLDFESPYFK